VVDDTGVIKLVEMMESPQIFDSMPKTLRLYRCFDHPIVLISVLTTSQNEFVDAYTDDGKVVCIKRIRRGDKEFRITQMLSTKELRADPRNHCVPIIEVINDPNNDSASFMVMPFLRPANSPPFQFVKEIMDFFGPGARGRIIVSAKPTPLI
jgi:hypothetical protein